MESIRRIEKPRRRGLEGGSLCPHLQLMFRLSALLGLSPLVFENGKSRFSYVLAPYSVIISCLLVRFNGLVPNAFLLYRFMVLTSYTLICSQIIAIGSHILSRYDLVVHTLDQLKNTQHNINNKVETLLAVNHQLFSSLKSLYKMESIRRIKKPRRRGLEDGLLCPHVQLVFRLSSLLGLSPLVFEKGESRFSYVLAPYSFALAALEPNCFLLYRFILLTSHTLISSQIAAVGCHILSRYDLVVHTLGQLKNRPHNINNKVETLLAVNHQLSRVVDTFASCYRLQLLFLEELTSDGINKKNTETKKEIGRWSAMSSRSASVPAVFFVRSVSAGVREGRVQVLIRPSPLLALGPNTFILYRLIGIVSYTFISSQIIAVGRHILSRYDLVVHTLCQLKNTPHNINNKVETLLAVNHQLSRSQKFDLLLYQLMISDEDFGLLDNV
ncbi:unnamed protein product, partial [Nezara viridula]